ncbi:unnamed protein product [Thelazia callipaeda]|uniref:Midasin n=1 Tax=Thelazia callipaeda TaxID=103827 RepID=A0A0N5D043_THECL|nr:unnamed protein product [Thelazia callipaeda]
MNTRDSRGRKRRSSPVDEVQNMKISKKSMGDCSTYEGNEGNHCKLDMPSRAGYRRQLMIGLESHTIVLIQGPTGSGKTFIVKEVAQELDLPCRIIQMSDQIDSKSLFGTFHCLDVAGEFHWKESNFAKYIRERGIILFEDVDSAPADLISQIIDLCNDRKVRLMSGEIIQMHREAYIVFTIRNIEHKRSFKSVDSEMLITSLPFEISLPPFTNEELFRAISILYTRVAGIGQKLIDLFSELALHVINRVDKRQLGTTDLLKACARLNDLDDLSDSVAVLRELVDCWTVHCNEKKDVLRLSGMIADNLSLNSDQFLYEMNLRMPEIFVTVDEVKCGRVNLKKSRTIIVDKSEFNKVMVKVALKSKINQMFEFFSKSERFGLTRDVCQLLERIAVCVNRMEPVLLVGETGIGKTAVIQMLADHVRVTLRVVNLSQHSDSSDLIGGYKPVSIRHLLEPLKKDYDRLFAATFDMKKNEKFLSHLKMCLSNGRYSDYVKMIVETARRTLGMSLKIRIAKLWADLLVRAERCKESLNSSSFSFAYIHGAVAQAASRGDWLLIDEINLATPECLDAVVNLTEDTRSKHSNFRLFACMNPASDIGKRNLPYGIRNRFTEIFVHETTEIDQLHVIARAYLPSTDVSKISILLELYQTLRATLPRKYSLRTLCRALAFTAENIFGSETRSMYEAALMSFMSNLGTEEQVLVEKLIRNKLSKVQMGKVPAKFMENHVKVEQYWIEKGNLELQDDPKYVYTPSVRKNLTHLARVVCSGKFSVLLEGETSCGKTAMILHLAKITGNTVIRINNHEHTDLQEYIGSYVPDGDGRFAFVEGPLVKATRNGYWIILDELNLAPTDVIEALNRLLDDNRELFIAETNAVVKAHPKFRLFATQNPACTYAGRKRLSRALLNRFVVLRFDQLPCDELARMVTESCNIAISAAKVMVSVFTDLRVQRSTVGVFSANDGLITLRDLFRWGQRLAGTDHNDWRQSLAEHGFLLLGSRCRNKTDAECVKKTLEKNLKRQIDVEDLFARDSNYLPIEFRYCNVVNNIVLTDAIRRMIILVTQSWRFNEPVLIVGETGCGKTTVAELLTNGTLLTLNCHERTEAADFLGSLRPVGDGTFKWIDGVVIQAMREGRPVLIDEISLASDSVLERLNPLLEPSRLLLLNDAGVSSTEVKAERGFNLSKALRNRFTEIWCQADVSTNDLVAIVNHLLSSVSMLDEHRSAINRCIVQFVLWFGENFSHVLRITITIRDIVTVTKLVAATIPLTDSISDSIYHAFSATLFDAFGTISTRINIDCEYLKKKAIEQLCLVMEKELGSACNIFSIVNPSVLAIDEDRLNSLVIDKFLIPFGSSRRFVPEGFTFNSLTCRKNILRIARGLIIDKPILLEGPPGCGKSSTVVALSSITGHPLTRLNLSEQTDLSDLFGSDVPIVLSDGTPSFAWRDGPILHAIKTGRWMNLASQSILEGLNACFDHRHQLFIPQLNRTFDVGANSTRTRFFACQNPCAQGGDRRNLPKSFMNRFTSIYISEMEASDYLVVMKNSFESVLGADVIQRMVNLNTSILNFMKKDTQFLRDGSPFEFNLRDLLRWAELTKEAGGNVLRSGGDIAYGFNLLYIWRLRSKEDKEKVSSNFINDMFIRDFHNNYQIIYRNSFHSTYYFCTRACMRILFHESFQFECTETLASFSVNDAYLQIGKVEIKRPQAFCGPKNLQLLSSQVILLDKLAVCVRMNWLTLLVGKRGSGKASAIKTLASLFGTELHTIRLTTESDSLDLLGSFEQVSGHVNLTNLKRKCLDSLASFPALLNDVKSAEDAFALRLVVQSAILLVDKRTAEKLEECNQELNKNRMRFGWVNSPFVNAFINGDWILIENVNCCSAAVLDRLNACLESSGELTLPESGNANSVMKAHKNFRVFFTMDHNYGRVSRAMRNRSVELFLSPDECTWFTKPQDIASVVLNTESEGIIQIPSAVMEACRNLSCWELLKLKMFLRRDGKDFETELKNFKDITFEESGSVCNEEKYIVRPTVNENFAIIYKQWEILVWAFVSEHDWLLGVLWASLSVPFNKSEVDGVIEKFSWTDSKSKKKAVKMIEKLKQNENFNYDERFHGSPFLRISEPLNTFVDQDKFIIKMCAVWAKLHLDTILPKEFSAVEISNLFSKVSESCSIIWNILLFVESCHQTLNTLVGGASMQIAWERLNSQQSSSLCSVANAVDKVWIVDKRAWEHFITFHELCNFIVPFRCYEQWNEYWWKQKLRKLLSSNIETRNEDCSIEGNGEEIEKFDIFDISCRLLKDVFCGFAMLNNGNKQNIDLGWIALGTQLFSLLWHSMDFKSVPEKFTLANFIDFPLQHKLLCLYCWKLGPHLGSFKLHYKEMLSTAIGQFESVVEIPALKSSNIALSDLILHLESLAYKLLPFAVPVNNCIDPVFRDELNFNYLMSKKLLLDNILGVLQSYQEVMSGQKDLILYSKSQHPFIACLLETRNSFSSLIKLLDSFLGTVHNCYRQLSHINMNRLDDLPQVKMKLAIAQIESFSKTIQFFCERVLAIYSAFPDIVFPYVMLLNVLVVANSYKRLHLLRKMHLHHLSVTYNFPSECKIKWSFFYNQLDCDVLFDWCISETTTMPKQLQKELVAFCLWQNKQSKSIYDSERCVIESSIKWIKRKIAENEWQKWFEDHTEKQEETYVYRERNVRREERDVDEDEIKMHELLPDFSSVGSEMHEFDDVCYKLSSKDYITGENLAELLYLLVDKKDINYCNIHMAFAWIIDTMLSCVYNLRALKKIGVNGDLQSFDVYRKNSRSELEKCIAAIKPLMERVKSLKDSWPEVTVLNDILKVSINADLWERVADHKHSLENELGNLRSLLVSWRKMEIRCWDNLLVREEIISEEQTLLMSWPLFEALDRNDKSDDDIIAMTIEWIQNSTLTDFKTRLLTAKLLVKFITLTKKCGKIKFCQRLESVVAYFEQFNTVIDQKLAEKKEPVMKKLSDFIKIMKYNDLNLWSVRLSAQKAHKQLFRIVKEFRLYGTDVVAPIFDELLPISSDYEAVATFAADQVPCDDFYARRAAELTQAVANCLTNKINLDNILELMEYTKCCDSLIRQDVRYKGDDKEKEKQRGRSLSERQKIERAVARFFKNSAALGLSSRKGLVVDTEQLTANVVSGIFENTILAKLIRHGGASRNIVLKKFHKPNTQIDAKSMNHLKGLTEFILNELCKCSQVLTFSTKVLWKMEQAKDMLVNCCENVKSLEKNSLLVSQQWLHRLQHSKRCLTEFNAVLEFMLAKLENAPENYSGDEEKILQFSGLVDSALSKLYKNDANYIVTLKSIQKIQEASAKILEAVDCSLLYSRNCEEIVIWKNSEVLHIIELVRLEIKEMEATLFSISFIMEEEVHEALTHLSEIGKSLLDPPVISQITEDVVWNGTETLLLVLQSIYKHTTSADFDSFSFINAFKWLSVLLQNVNLDRSVEKIWNLCAELSNGDISVKFNCLEQIISVSSTVYRIFAFIWDLLQDCAVVLALYYISFTSMSVVLLDRGYVNPIEKREEGSEGNEGILQSYDDDVAGLGDAKGEKDVGDDIDETGQVMHKIWTQKMHSLISVVEGLKNDEEDMSENEKGNEKDDKPLDMDDDFGGCLEDIDREEQNDNEKDGSGEEDTPEVDNEMGNIDESEEEKLDPDLWDEDENENDNDKELDEGSKGANSRTHGLVAKTNESTCRNDEEKSEEQERDNEVSALSADDEASAIDSSDDNDMENPDASKVMDESKSVEDKESLQSDNDCSEVDTVEDNMEFNNDTELDDNNNPLSCDEEQIASEIDENENSGLHEELQNDKISVVEGNGNEEGGFDKLSKISPDILRKENIAESNSTTESEALESAASGEKGNNGNDQEKLENIEKCEKKKQKEELRELADDIADISLQKNLPNEGGEQDEESSDFGHTEQNSIGSREQIVIDKSSIEEAKNSKAHRDHLKNHNLCLEDVKENSETDIEMLEENKKDDFFDMNDIRSDIRNSVIHMSADFYHLQMEPSSCGITSVDLEEVMSSSTDAEERWNKISDSVSVLAAELSESLRTIIEPTVSSKFEGDYRTGKRLNMRRLIPYIASGYRKDQIWLRRTKKARHNYQILIAVDDSASMNDSHIKLKACQSVALIECGLRKCEIGQLGICKFGASTKLISSFSNYDSISIGGALINELNFDQNRTDLVLLLRQSKMIFEENRGRERNNQMLIIVSDGRGVLAGGAEAIKKAVAELHADEITVLFVAIDSGEESIADMKVAEFTPGGGVNLVPYLNKFPFPFYVVVRHIAMLPVTIADAVRQWFALAASA